MILDGFNPKITWQVTCQFCFWCWEMNDTLQLSFQRNVTLNLFYMWWSFNGQCYLDRKIKAIFSKSLMILSFSQTGQSKQYHSICICFSLFGFCGPSRLFHSFWAKSIVRWGQNGRPPDHPQAELGLSCMWPNHARTQSGEMKSDL